MSGTNIGRSVKRPVGDLVLSIVAGVLIWAGVVVAGYAVLVMVWRWAR